MTKTIEKTEDLLNYANLAFQIFAGFSLLLAFLYLPSPGKSKAVEDSATAAINSNNSINEIKSSNAKEIDKSDIPKLAATESKSTRSASSAPKPNSEPNIVRDFVKSISSTLIDKSSQLTLVNETKASEIKIDPLANQNQPKKEVKTSSVSPETQSNLKSIPPLEEVKEIPTYIHFQKTPITKDNVLERIPFVTALPFYAIDASFDIATSAVAAIIRVPLRFVKS